MNIKKRISEIVLLTLAVVMGGGYIYYSLLTNSNDNFNKNTMVVFNDMPVGSSNNKPGNIYAKKPQRTASGQHNTTTSGVSGLQLPSLTELSAVGSHSSDMFSGNTGYSYSYNAKPGIKSIHQQVVQVSVECWLTAAVAEEPEAKNRRFPVAVVVSLLHRARQLLSLCLCNQILQPDKTA